MRTAPVAGAAFLAALVAVLAPAPASAHCDSVDGPVVRDGRAALESGRVATALRWVVAAKEAEVEQAFRQALAVRGLGDQARALADRYFFETLVRIHREGEGAPFTGLKAAGHVQPAIAAADQALESGSVEPLVGMVVRKAERQLREAFARATASRRHADESVQRGREAVAAYAEYVHLAERLLAAAGPTPHHEHEEANPTP